MELISIRGSVSTMHMSTTTGQWYQTNFDLSYYTYIHRVTIDDMDRCMLLESKIDE